MFVLLVWCFASSPEMTPLMQLACRRLRNVRIGWLKWRPLSKLFLNDQNPFLHTSVKTFLIKSLLSFCVKRTVSIISAAGSSRQMTHLFAHLSFISQFHLLLRNIFFCSLNLQPGGQVKPNAHFTAHSTVMAENGSC